MFQKKHSKSILFSSLSVVLCAFLAVVFLRGFIFRSTREGNNCANLSKESTLSAKKLVPINAEQLKEFDGIRNPKVYIGLDCLVYDVTSGKDQYYGEGKPYHYLVARDATSQLKIFGGDIIKRKYPVVGILSD